MEKYGDVNILEIMSMVEKQGLTPVALSIEAIYKVVVRHVSVPAFRRLHLPVLEYS